MIQNQKIKIIAGATTSEPVSLPGGARLVRVQSPIMSVATSMVLSGRVGDGGSYETMYQGSTNTSLSFTLNNTVRSISIPPEYTAGLSAVQIKTNAAEATDKEFTVVYEW
jgi:hypothetical protein